MRVGAHVDQHDPVAQGTARGVPLIQTFLGDPQSWKKPATDFPGGTAGLREALAEARLDLYVHAPYRLNVASTNNRIRIPSRKLLQQTVSAAAEAGALAVIVHGGHVTAEDDPAQGFANWRKAVDALRLDVPILIENTAGGNHAMARRLEAIEGLWSAIRGSDNIDQVGFCLDTCHAHAGGLDLHTVVDDLISITGRIDLVHCNDSRDEPGSGADRHTSLGHGQIPPELIAHVVQQADTDVVLETPADGHAEDLAFLRERVAS